MKKRFTYAIIGDPVKHSRSPEIYAPLFLRHSIDADFLRIRVTKDELANIREIVKSYSLNGFAVTMPHKKTIIRYLDGICDEVKASGSVNIVTVEQSSNGIEGKLIGHNTDGEGLINALKEAKIDVSDKDIVILGNGGAACGAKEAMIRQGGRVKTVSRREGHSLDAAIVSNMYNIEHCDILINATPLGMLGFPEFDSLGFLQRMKHGAAAVDMVYAGACDFADGSPTRFVHEAKMLGLISFGGDRMLYHQGLIAFRLWTGFDAL